MTPKEAGPKPRHAQGESGEDSSRASASLHHERPQVNVSRRSPLVAGAFLALIVFSVCYLAGHILAAITGWHAFVYIGFGFACWFGGGALLAFIIGGVCGHDR